MSYYRRNISEFLVRTDQFRSKYIKKRNFLIVLSFVVGIISALAAVLLKVSVQMVEHSVEKLNHYFHDNWLTAMFPLVGVGISMLLLKRIFKGRLSRGVGFIVDSIFTKQSRIPFQHTFGHMLTAAVTVASGGSVGLEAPIVATGAAIGSNTARDMRLSYKDTTLLLACGVASGIAAVFNSPIAGIIFALEVLMIDFNIPFFIPLLISTATATVISQVLYPDKFVFLIINGWDLKALPFYVLMGSVCGLVSVYTTTVVEKVEGYFHKQKLGWRPWLMAGVPLCVLIYFLPSLYGEGYSTITNLLHGNYNELTRHTALQHMGNQSYAIIIMCVLLILFKSFTAALTVSAGGNGGVFAPALIIGGLVGFLFTYVLHLTGLVELRTPNFIIAAMAGVLAGVMHSPLTAIFLLAEITGGYALFVPLMIVVAISYFITRKYVRHSIYHKALFNNNILKEERDEDHF
ncbi:MAG: chloride channel protein [Sphingobacteriales bacterium]|nr:MAG: chloride channel protein [Sphingobacteriales bacterium]